MDEMTAFDQQIAREVAREAGPSEPVDGAAIFTAITATQSQKWRFQSMFSATKFVVAGAVVALFGGFLLTGVLTQPSDDRPPVVGASASVATQAEPTDAATSEPDTTTDVDADRTTTPDLLPGVDLVTEEVEPGVYRVLNDGVRDLADGWPDELQISKRNVVAGRDGSVWLFRPDPETDHESSVFFKLGAPQERADWTIWVYDDGVVGPDGVMWYATTDRQQRVPEPRLRSFDGADWSDYPAAEDGGVVTGVEVTSDGAVWTTTQTGDRRRMSAARWDRGEWQRLGGRVPANAQRRAGSWGHHVSMTDDGDVWLLPSGPSGNDAGIFRNAGSGWKPIAPPSGWTPSVGHVGRDGTLWATLRKSKKRKDTLHVITRLGRFDGEEWQVFGKGERFPDMAGIHQGLPSRFEVAGDGRVWLLDTASEDEGVWCGGVVNFDGTSWVRLLDRLCAYDADLAPDGNLWLEAGEFEGPIHLYLITPEAVAE
jgi:hypothetical protein